jgi:hypothetical protein
MSREGSWQTKFFVLSDMQNRSPPQLIFNNDDDDGGGGDGDEEAGKSLK